MCPWEPPLRGLGMVRGQRLLGKPTITLITQPLQQLSLVSGL